MDKRTDYYTPARRRASEKYHKEKLAQVSIWVKKEEKTAIQEEAKVQGMSMKRFIAKAVNEMAGKQLISVADDEGETRDES